MPDDSPATRVTQLLQQAGDSPPAAEELLPLVYQQLRAAAQLQMANERAGHTLQPTALVHEAFLKLVGDRDLPWRNRRHFYAAAAEAMRQILLDHAKSRGRQKRGGDHQRRTLDFRSVADLVNLEDSDQIVALDDAIRRLGQQDARAGEIVRLRFLAGLTIERTADAMDLSERTVKRDWEFARAWLFKAMRESEGGTQING